MFPSFAHCEKFGGTWDVIKLAFEYDAKIVFPLLMVCFEWLNPSTIVVVIADDDVRLELEENIFGVGASIEKSS
jgi:hypothetical protein